jgi:hypothetical protein
VALNSNVWIVLPAKVFSAGALTLDCLLRTFKGSAPPGLWCDVFLSLLLQRYRPYGALDSNVWIVLPAKVFFVRALALDCLSCIYKGSAPTGLWCCVFLSQLLQRCRPSGVLDSNVWIVLPAKVFSVGALTLDCLLRTYKGSAPPGLWCDVFLSLLLQRYRPYGALDSNVWIVLPAKVFSAGALDKNALNKYRMAITFTTEAP